MHSIPTVCAHFAYPTHTPTHCAYPTPLHVEVFTELPCAKSAPCTYILPRPYYTILLLFNMVGLKYNVRVKDIEPLSEGCWADWSQEIMFSFMEVGLVEYLDGSVPRANGY